MSAKQKVTPYRNLDLDETGVVVDASPTKIRHLCLNNNHATALLYVKFYDKTTAATAADTPKYTIPVAPNKLGGQINVNLTHAEMVFNDGLSMRCVTGVADNDNTGAGTNEMVVNLGLVENLAYTL